MTVPLLDARRSAEAIVRYRKDFRLFAAEQLKIRGEPLKFWPCQEPLIQNIERQMERRGFARCIWMKARQVGCSTLAQAFIAWRAMLWPNVSAIVIADESERSRTLFEISRSFYDSLEDGIRPIGRYITKRELVFANPSPVTRSSDPGLQSRIVIDSAAKRSVGIGASWTLAHLCLGGETLVWTALRGFVRLSGLRLGEMVVTDSGAEACVSAISRRPSDGRSWVRVTMWGARGAPLMCTSDHRVLTTRGWVDAGGLTSHDEVVLPIKQLHPQITEVDLCPYLRRPSGERRDSWRHGPTEFPLTRESGWVLGLFVAEGYPKWAAGRVASGIAFSLHHDELSWASRIQDVLGPWAKSVSTAVLEHHRVVVSVYSRAIASAFLDWFYAPGDVFRSHTKQFPEWVWKAPREFQEGLVAGYFCGDGSRKNSAKWLSVTTVSPVLAGQVRELLLALRVGWPSLWWRPAAMRKRYANTERNNREIWTVGVSGRAAIQLYQWCGEDVAGLSARKELHWRMGWREVWVRVCKVESIPSPPEMFDVEVRHTDHSYRVGGCVVANSEAARFRDPSFVLDGIIPAVHRVPGTLVIMESSAEMAGTWYRDFFEASQKGQTGFEAMFVPWFLQPEYWICPVCGVVGVCADADHTNRALRLLDPSGDERALMAEFGLDPGHIQWMREKLAEMGNDWDLFRQSFPMTAEDGWVVPGTQVFSMKCLRELRLGVRPPNRIADVYAGPRILDAPQGHLWIWEEPQAGKTFDIGVDIAMGMGRDDEVGEDQLRDLSVICVLERGSNTQVAEWASKAVDPVELATIVYWLGKYYNTAQVAVETNSIGRSTNSQLAKLGYENLYTWRFRDEIVPRYSRKIGWECVVPETKILTADLRWVSAGSLVVGDQLLGCDEFRPAVRRSRYRLGGQQVTALQKFSAPLIGIVLDNGRRTLVSRTHPFMTFRRSFPGWRWRLADKVRCGDLVKCLPLWETLTTYDAGRLSAFLDGEGHLSQGQGRARGLHLLVSQAEGELAQEINELWASLGFDWTFKWLRHKRPHEKPIATSGVIKVAEVLRALGSLRPTRLLRKFRDHVNLSRITLQAIPNGTISEVYDAGVGEVIGLSTEPDHTLIADGIVGHNTNVRSKPWMVSFAVHQVLNGRVIVRSELLLREMEHYVRKGHQDWAAAAGHSDDRTVAWMIALLTSDDENFEKHFGLSRESKRADGSGDGRRVVGSWEADLTFGKALSERNDLPWD